MPFAVHYLFIGAALPQFLFIMASSNCWCHAAIVHSLQPQRLSRPGLILLRISFQFNSIFSISFLRLHCLSVLFYFQPINRWLHSSAERPFTAPGFLPPHAPLPYHIAVGFPSGILVASQRLGICASKALELLQRPQSCTVTSLPFLQVLLLSLSRSETVGKERSAPSASRLRRSVSTQSETSSARFPQDASWLNFTVHIVRQPSGP